jgi:hypothetical protein
MHPQVKAVQKHRLQDPSRTTRFSHSLSTLLDEVFVPYLSDFFRQVPTLIRHSDRSVTFMVIGFVSNVLEEV